MHFKDMIYERPDYEKVTAEYTLLLDELEKTENAEDFYEVFMKLEKIRTHVTTMSSIAMTRHTIDTRDEFYDKEQEYWDEYGPMYSVFENRLSKICVECPYREDLYRYIPETFFKIAECSMKSFSEEIVPLLQKENKLGTEYEKLRASAQIEFRGETYNLSTISLLAEDQDRDTRKGATDAKWGFYAANEAEFDRIYDELVKVRVEIAKTLGYESFTEVGYYRMWRLDYDREMVANYRRQVAEDIVPLAEDLYARQARRLGVDKVRYYDDRMEYPDGNPQPQGTYDELIAAARKMYHEMSPETGEFIDVMIENDLWDLKSRDGKEMGGYCTSFPEYKVPFIFANFNGTSGDVDVLTHEAGHAFQYYTSSKTIPLSDLQFPTMESAEIDSMSMEFNAWPWMELFFKDKADRYRFLHLSGAVKFLPYGVLVDHFQHEVYANPEWTPDERKACWRSLEKMYQPYKDYEGCDTLEKGCWWFGQGHIFTMPFYYIDYTLAQVCALQFWARGQKKDPDTWKDYLTLCSLGGTQSFTQLVRSANLRVPFEDGCLKDVVVRINGYLGSVDDTRI